LKKKKPIVSGETIQDIYVSTA